MAERKRSRRGNNEGSIYKAKDGRWRASVTVGTLPNGKQKRRYLSGPTRKEVAIKLDEILSEVRTGSYVKPERITVGAWLDAWLKDYSQPSVRLNTWRSYEGAIRVHLKPALGDTLLRMLQPSQIQRLLNDMVGRGLSPRTAEVVHGVLHSALKQAVLNGLVRRNAADAVRKPKRRKKPIRVLTVTEQEGFLEASADERLNPLIVTLLGTGMRSGEALALQWEDVDLPNHSIRITRTVTRTKDQGGPARTKIVIQEPKTAAGRRSIPLPPSVVSVLQQWRVRQAEERLLLGAEWAAKTLVFTTVRGTMIGARNFALKLVKISKHAGLPKVNAHALRHTYATRMLESGVPAKYVQEMLGHTTITLTLDIYSHVMPEMKQGAANAIDGFLQLKPRSCRVAAKDK
jgi:integrase